MKLRFQKVPNSNKLKNKSKKGFWLSEQIGIGTLTVNQRKCSAVDEKQVVAIFQMQSQHYKYHLAKTHFVQNIPKLFLKCLNRPHILEHYFPLNLHPELSLTPSDTPSLLLNWSERLAHKLVHLCINHLDRVRDWTFAVFIDFLRYIIKIVLVAYILVRYRRWENKLLHEFKILHLVK